jgi:hypothetical protein
MTMTTWMLIFVGMLLTLNLLTIHKQKADVDVKPPRILQLCTTYTNNKRLLAEWISFHRERFDICIVGAQLMIKSISKDGPTESQCQACFGNDHPSLVLEPNEFLNIKDEQDFVSALDSKNAIQRVYFGKDQTNQIMPSVIFQHKRGPHSSLGEDKERFKASKDCEETMEGNACRDLLPATILNPKTQHKHYISMDVSIARIHHYSLGHDMMDREREYWNQIYDDSLTSTLSMEAYLKAVSDLELELIFSE